MPGDENGDGRVDAADYVALRKLGSGAEEVQAWREHFGESSDPGTGGSSSTPEPASAWILAFFVVAAALSRRRAVCGNSDVFCKNSCLAEMKLELA
jgi:MYXO-CTERM domain-containing protein